MQAPEDLSHLTTLAERLKYARKASDLSQTYIVNQTGIPQSTYSNLEIGKNLNSSYLPSIAKVLKVNLDWLLTGEIKGDIEATACTSDIKLAPVVELNLLDHSKTTKIANFGLMELVSMTTVAAYPFQSEFFEHHKFDLNDFKVVQCNFDHLDGFINFGDYFAISTMLKDQVIRHGCYYVVVYLGEIMFVQIFKHGMNHYKLHCTNQKYYDLEVSGEMLSEFKVIGRISWKSGLI